MTWQKANAFRIVSVRNTLVQILGKVPLPVHGYGGYYSVCEFTEHLFWWVTNMCSMLLNVLLHLKLCTKIMMSNLMSVGLNRQTAGFTEERKFICYCGGSPKCASTL